MPTPRRFAVGDIHGCLETFRTLLFSQINLKKQDKLFLLGDYVHRGPDSEGVLDLILQLKQDGYQVFPIMGNHELMYKEGEGPGMPYHYRTFIEELPYYREDDGFLFVHAEFNFLRDEPFEDKMAMAWGLGYPIKPDLEFLAGRKVVHGHVIHSLSDIFDAVHDRAPIIPLDNGCYQGLFKDTPSVVMGNLCALNLDEMQLIVQENVDRLG